MRVRISYDDGQSWPVHRLLEAGTSAYSSMAKTADYHVAALYEIAGDSQGRRSIVLKKFNLPWILNGVSETDFTSNE